jgi:hypothetical protein
VAFSIVVCIEATHPMLRDYAQAAEKGEDDMFGQKTREERKGTSMVR